MSDTCSHDKENHYNFEIHIIKAKRRKKILSKHAFKSNRDITTKIPQKDKEIEKNRIHFEKKKSEKKTFLSTN